MALETPLVLQALTGDAAIPYTAQQIRGLIQAVVPLQGVTSANDLLVSQRAAGANMSVDIAAGQAAIRGTNIALQGTYLVRSTSIVNVPVGTAHATLRRIDLVVARVYDRQADGGASYSWTIEVIPGIAGDFNGPPSTPFTSVALAEITVPAASASIVAANITDKRTLNTLGAVPLWIRSGGDAQSIPNNTLTTYAGATSSTVGVSTNANPGEFVVQTAGRYIVTATTRWSAGGNANTERALFIDHVNPDGFARRRPATTMAFPAAVPATGMAMSCSGMVQCVVGDMLRARLFQNGGVAVTLMDAQLELSFSGVWVGP